MTSNNGPILKLLLVDDEPDLLDLLKKLLSKTRFEILTADSPPAALEIIRSEGQRIALVISDFTMPSGTGFDLRREMLGEYKDIPFVLISGNISRDTALEAINLKIAGFLPKPFSNEELTQSIEVHSKDRIAAILEDDELREGFVADATQLIEEMEDLIFKLEDEPQNADNLNRVFACAHTIKGASGFFKPDTIHRFMHRYEDYLSLIKKGEMILDSKSSQVLLSGLDQLKNLVELLKTQKPFLGSFEDLLSLFVKPTLVSNDRKEKKEDSLKISLSVLNRFMEKNGEITVLRNMVNKTLNVIENTYANDPNVQMLNELMSELQNSIESMQNQIEELKKIPVRQLTRPLQRVVKDLCTNLKKQIRLEFVGDDLRIDQRLFEALNKCLIHLVRNSADHGIAQSGKIKIEFLEFETEIIVLVKDDGRGIDAQRVKNKAIEKGLLTELDAAKKTDGELQLLIFEPGFSTAEVVTDVSGRGVGTDMVKKTIIETGGSISIQSEVNKGTEFTIKLPIPKSVQIISSLLVKFGEETYAIPQEHVDRIISVEKATLTEISRKTFFVCEDQIDSIIQVEDIFHKPLRSKLQGYLIRIRTQKGVFCICVDDILGAEDIVVKSVSGWFKNLNIYKGCTFLGDRRVGLILDCEKISQEFQINKKPLIDTDQKVAMPVSHYLLFTLSNKTLCALSQDAIFRIEKIDITRVQYWKDQAFILYNNSSLPLIDMAQAMKSPLVPWSSSTLDVIVVRNAGVLVGYVVQQIEDLVTSVAFTDPVFFAQGFPVHRVAEQVITLVTLESLAA